jgi:hypothetical protein
VGLVPGRRLDRLGDRLRELVVLKYGHCLLHEKGFVNDCIMTSVPIFDSVT